MRVPVIDFPGPVAFRGYVPRRELRRAIELIWFARGRATYSQETVLPNGVVELIVNLGPPHRVVERASPERFTRFRRAWIAGMQDQPLTIAAEAESDLVGIRFRPGGASAIVPVPLHALRRAVVDVDAVPVRGIAELRERLGEARSELARLDLVEQHFLDAATVAGPDRRVHAALALLARDAGASIRRTAAHLGLSHKHLISLFHRDVGLGPKRLARVLRFAGVVRELTAAGQTRWADLAARHGFADQPHLVSEFRAFAGVTPTGYLQLRSNDPNHLLDG